MFNRIINFIKSLISKNKAVVPTDMKKILEVNLTKYSIKDKDIYSNITGEIVYTSDNEARLFNELLTNEYGVLDVLNCSIRDVICYRYLRIITYGNNRTWVYELEENDEGSALEISKIVSMDNKHKVKNIELDNNRKFKINFKLGE